MLVRLIRIIFWVIACLPGAAVAQELIPNGSFETYTDCPRQDNLLNLAAPWYNPTRTTPDFYNQCFPNVQIELPPHTGQGLARLFLDQGWAEYLATPLAAPLKADECYYFEMYVSTKTLGQYLPQTLGAYFSDKPITSTNTELFAVRPQILDALAKPTIRPLVWNRISGYLKAKGDERYLTIGSFYELPKLLAFYYLFVDDVSLRPIQLDLGKDTTLCGRQSQYLLNAKTPGATEYRWQDGSDSATFLVKKPGKYWVTVTTPCKVLRDTIQIDYSLDFNLGADTTLCNGQTLTLNAPPGGTAYRWQDGSAQTTYSVRQAGTYSLRVTQQSCTAADTIQIRYTRPPQLELGPNRELCGAETYTLVPAFAEGSFRWQDSVTTIERVVRSSGVFRASVRNDCATVTDSVAVGYGDCGCVIYTPNSFTPNADGINDVFSPLACGDITLTSLAVFDRWGEVIFKTETTPFQWNGFYRNSVCPGGVYAWRIGYDLNQGGKLSHRQQQGSLILVH